MEDLIQTARAGHSGAVDALVRRFEPVALGFAQRAMGARVRRFVDPEAVAQAALQEVFLALERLPEGCDEEELRRRLHRCVRSRVLQDVRRNRAHVGESQAPEDAGPWRTQGTVTRADERAWVRRLVLELPEPYAEVVQLCALEELSFVEAGRRLGLEADTVRKRYQRASALLRRTLERLRG
jgi:RNA polymerase sigma-70 factor (ECF subfamily)